MIDPIQKEAIVKLNQHGMAAAMIARILGLEPSSVRSHLARNPHKRPAKNRDATYTFTCIGCGTTFTAYGNKHRRYCRHECYVTHRSKKCPR